MLELFAKTFDPTDFYTALTPTQRGVVLPSSLEKYAEGLEKFLGLSLNFTFEEFQFYTSDVVLSEKRAILLFSGGVDSTHTLIANLDKYEKIVCVFIENLNPSISSREKRAVMKWASHPKVDLVFLKHHKDLKRLHREDPILTNEKNIKNLLESQVKNQYGMYLCLELIEAHRTGVFLVPMDIEGDPDTADYDDVYSDTRESYELFGGFLKELCGVRIEFSEEYKRAKISLLVEQGQFGETWFCYMSQLYFKAQQNRTKPPFSNMCGACWKCKRYSPILNGIMK